MLRLYLAENPAMLDELEKLIRQSAGLPGHGRSPDTGN